MEEVTAHRRTEEEGQLLYSIVENSPDFIGIFDHEGNPLFLNRAGRKLVGLDETQDIRRTTIPEFFVPEQRAFIEEVVLPATQRDGRWRGELNFRHFKTGALIPVLYDIFQVDDPKTGKPIHFATITRDITERKRAEKALHDSEARFRTIADNIPQLAWIADSECRVDWFNRGWLEYTGTTLEDNVGAGWKGVHHPDYVERVAEKFERALREGTDWEDTFPLRGKDGKYRWFLSRMNAVRDESGKVVRYIGTNTDVTDRLQLEDQIKLQAAQLADESRRKDEFLAMLSHELRNPLAPIRSAVHLMKLQDRGNENPLQAQAREIIERQVDNLTRLIGDLLEVSRVLSGRIHLDLQPVDIHQVVAHAAQTAAPLIEKQGHTLVMHRCEEGLWVSADATRLEEVLVNLLNNAAKYTPESGKIDVHCERDAGHARVRVRDNGMGIDREILPRIFDLFTQADNSLARAQGGLGIGLSLAQRLIVMHGGTIEARSEGRGHGAEFIVRLPLTGAPDEAGGSPHQTHEPAINPDGLRVLMVDDNIDHVTMLAGALRLKGYNVQATHTGLEALEIARQRRPDIVLLDIGMPGLDGYEVARRLRSDTETKGMRLIAITGYGRDADKAAAKAAGFDEHLTKPVDFAQLERILAALGRKSESH